MNGKLPKVLFVHGTGVRKPSYLATFAILKEAFDHHKIAWELETCLWGDDLGSKPPNLALPDAHTVPRETRAPGTEEEYARWALLYGDPTFELHLLMVRPRTSGPTPPGAVRLGAAVWTRLSTYHPTGDVLQFLRRWRLEVYWDIAFTTIVHDPVTAGILERSQEELGEPTQAISRAVVATLLLEAIRDFRPMLDGAHRDELVDLLVKDWGGNVGGVGTYLLRFFGSLAASAATPVVRWKRNELTDAVSPASGDVLLYQARGQRIREYIKARVAQLGPDVTILAHSLGGIASVDLLAKNELPEVTRLITVGTQASLLYEIGALYGLETGKELPQHFPRWLNLYDPRDFLSYVAAPVFKSDRIFDQRIESRQPFPQSHGAYWTNSQTWDAIAGFLQ